MSLILIISIVGIILDRITKLWAVAQLTGGHDVIIIKDLFQFSYLENRGAAFGILQGKQLFLIAITAIVILAMLIYTVKKKPKSIFYKIGIGMITAGAIGNLIDRATIKYVIDFILVHYKDAYYFPTFNVADMFVSIGVVFMCIYIIKDVE